MQCQLDDHILAAVELEVVEIEKHECRSDGDSLVAVDEGVGFRQVEVIGGSHFNQS